MDPRQACRLKFLEFFDTLPLQGLCPSIGRHPLDIRELLFEVLKYLKQISRWQKKAIRILQEYRFDKRISPVLLCHGINISFDLLYGPF